MPRRSIVRISPRTTSPATRPRNGSRCAATTSTRTTASTCASRPTSRASMPRAHEVVLADGGKVAYDRLLLATGAEPVRLPIPGAGPSQVHTLRSLADSRAIIEQAKSAKRALVIGASFIGLEVAASLRHRGLEVHVVAPEKRPMERILGAGNGRLRARPARGARRRLPPRGHGGRHRRQEGHAEERRHAGGGSRGHGRRRAAAPGAGGEGRASRSIAASPSTPSWRPARRTSSPRATSRAGPTRTAGRPFASSIGWWPSARGRSRP